MAPPKPYALIAPPPREARARLTLTDARTEAFLRSRFADGLDPEAGGVAAHSILWWHGPEPWDPPWADFDPAEFLGWFTAVGRFHAAAVDELYRGWPAVLGWLRAQGELGEADGRRILIELRTLEPAARQLFEWTLERCEGSTPALPRR